jgi:predicted nucleic acid-binding protein
MESESFGFNVSSVLVGILRLMKQKGILEEQEILDILWEAKDAQFPWTKEDIKDLLKL